MTWVFSVEHGMILRDLKVVGVAYSGHGKGLDDPEMENFKGMGPIPRGKWKIGTFFDHPHLGPIVAHLTPALGTNTFGRNGFFIHGDNREVNHTASDGCIILARPMREQIRDSGDRDLSVI